MIFKQNIHKCNVTIHFNKNAKTRRVFDINKFVTKKADLKGA